MLGCNILFVGFVNATLNDGQLFVEIELLKRERERSGSAFKTLRFIKYFEKKKWAILFPDFIEARMEEQCEMFN